MPRMSAHEVLLKISRLEAAISERTAVSKALQLPSDGPEVEKIMELIKKRDALREWLPEPLAGRH